MTGFEKFDKKSVIKQHIKLETHMKEKFRNFKIKLHKLDIKSIKKASHLIFIGAFVVFILASAMSQGSILINVLGLLIFLFVLFL